MKPALYIVHWPGNSIPACEDHVHRLVILGSVLGLQITRTPCEETICANCANEAKAKRKESNDRPEEIQRGRGASGK